MPIPTQEHYSAIVFAPLAVESFAIRAIARAPGIRVVRSGMGPARAKQAARRVLSEHVDAVMVLGFCGALSADLRPGDVVVADTVTAVNLSRVCAGAQWISEELRRAGVAAIRGRLRSAEHIVRGAERATLAADGAIAVDMESAWLAPEEGTPFAVVRAVVDTRQRELSRPWDTLGGGLRAYRSLGITGRVARAWLERQSRASSSSKRVASE